MQDQNHTSQESQTGLKCRCGKKTIDPELLDYPENGWMCNDLCGVPIPREDQQCLNCHWAKHWTEGQGAVNKIPAGKVRCVKLTTVGIPRDQLHRIDSWCNAWEQKV